MAEPIWSRSDIPRPAATASPPPPASAPIPSFASPLIALPAARGYHRMFLPPMAFPTGYRRSLRAHADLLDRLLGGYVVPHAKTSESIYVCAGSPKRYGNVMTWVRLEDLTWRIEPGDQSYVGDLVALIQLRFSLDRERPMAWELAVAFLQRADARDLAMVEALVQNGDAMRAAGTRASSNPSEKTRAALSEAREAFEQELRAAMSRGAA